ncbi:MAG: branched-chain amino acid transport system II carrier protein [Desulfoplanes sp.]|nr:branched-chain amino acid transport system II carrier protein [Desulfoplanes sp.]
MKTLTSKKLLPIPILILISGAMFSSHFGVGDLIFPPILGRDSGADWFTASIGYALINSIGVWLAYLACAQQNQSLSGIATKILGKFFGKIYTAIPVLIMVFFILPRVASATHEMAVLPLFPSVPLGVSLGVFFLVSFYIAYTRATVMDKLGRFLAPALILFVLILVVKGIADPLATPGISGCATPLKDGMLNAYNTMNAIGALLFGGWILHELKMRHIADIRDMGVNLNIIGIGTALLLSITSTSLVYLGKSSGPAFMDAPIGVLSTDIAKGLLGQAGLIGFAVIMALSCLSTSAAISSMAGDMFSEMSGEKLKYRVIVTAATLAGFIVGLVGLSRIVKYTVPWLVLLYPSIIVLIITALYRKFDEIRIPVISGVIAALVFGFGDMLGFYGMKDNPISVFAAALPLGNQGIGWMLPTFVLIALIWLLLSVFSQLNQKRGKEL